MKKFLAPLLLLSVALAACETTPATGPADGDPDAASVRADPFAGLATMPITASTDFPGRPASLQAMAASTTHGFLGFYHHPAEEQTWLAMEDDTAYYRDWFVGGETWVTASASGETQHAQALLPNGTTLTWGKITFHEDWNGQKDCWVSPSWVLCGGKTIYVLWYANAQCRPTGSWTMKFFHNDAVFHEGAFQLLPSMDTTKITAMSQLDYPNTNYANRCTMPGTSARHNCDGRAGEIELSVARLGCWLVSGAMMLTYHGAAVDPPTLNTWLIENNGYSNGDVDPFKVAEYGRTRGVDVRYVGRSNTRDDPALEGLVCRYGPQIIPVWGSGFPPGASRSTGLPRGHFVLADGRDAARTTHLIVDPSGGKKTSLSGHYGNEFGGMRTYQGPEYTVVDQLNGLVFFLHSPAELLITDPTGRRTGVDPATGRVYAEIPNADYGYNLIDDLTDGEATVEDATKEFTQVRPGSGTYTVSVAGTAEGAYDLELRTYSATGALSQRRLEDIPTAPGIVHSFEISYSTTAGPGPIEMTGGFLGGGQRSDVDAFLSFGAPTERQTRLPAGATSFPVIIYYGPTIDAATFTAELDRVDVRGLFTPVPGGFEIVTLPLPTGRTTLVVSVEGVAGGRTARDTDRLTFIVP